MTLSERIARIEAERNLPSNVVPMDKARERRAVPRWIEYTRATERSAKDLTQFVPAGSEQGA